MKTQKDQTEQLSGPIVKIGSHAFQLPVSNYVTILMRLCEFNL